MNVKKTARLRRARKTRSRIRRLGMPRLSVYRSAQHIYAQIISAEGDKVIASASTVEKSLRSSLEGTGNRAAAAVVGKAVAEKSLAAGIEAVAFDRSGYKFHGRIKELAEAAREAGLKF
ncbi:MAG: 50S ribosomal protein L18 [Xanthomonadales bacterium]|jgi:large subunit ribosomal protein L18|nr:50S ribosomal protein L18 [Xanthomonadales bacterium]